METAGVREIGIKTIQINKSNFFFFLVPIFQSSVRQNVLAFLADLFYILEVRPAKCIRPPGLMRDRFPINEGKKSFGQFYRYVGPLLEFFRIFLSYKKNEKKCEAILLVWYCNLFYFFRCWWQLVFCLVIFSLVFFFRYHRWISFFR